MVQATQLESFLQFMIQNPTAQIKDAAQVSQIKYPRATALWRKHRADIETMRARAAAVASQRPSAMEPKHVHPTQPQCQSQQMKGFYDVLPMGIELCEPFVSGESAGLQALKTFDDQARLLKAVYEYAHPKPQRHDFLQSQLSA